ncbi:serine hydrolase [Winogradskyella sp. A3E31]|uniref:serine hydrolase n=1 Tax=Winogradskyella sp. A3E31 TaxID=3349637 RepID=UPI00398B86D4
MRLFRFLLLFILSTQFVVAQDAIIPDDYKDYIKARVDKGINPSISMAYIVGDAVEFYNYGKTQLNDGESVDKHSVYEIGSISKVFTTILLADEILKGKMKLSDPIQDYLPESVTVPVRNDKVITLKDLATHTSGLPRMPGNFKPADLKNPFADYSVKQLYDFLSNYELPRDIGSQYEYSNLGMGLLGHILELHTGKTYESLVVNRIAKPLDMADTQIEFTDKMKSHLAIGHNEQLETTSNWDITTLAGAGAIRSTTSDMVKFVKANLTDDGSDLYKAMALSHKIAYTNDAKTFNIGLGWHYSNGDSIVWHNGGTGGYRAFSGFLKDSNKGVVVFTNSTFSVDNIGLKILGQPLELKIPEKRVYPEVVVLSNDILDSYVGKYQLTPQFFITVSRKDNQLVAQATGQPEFEIFPSADNEFFLKVVEASITFNKDEAGNIVSMTLHQNGQDVPGKKIE